MRVVELLRNPGAAVLEEVLLVGGAAIITEWLRHGNGVFTFQGKGAQKGAEFAQLDRLVTSLSEKGTKHERRINTHARLGHNRMQG
jgi:hypothetical protein